VTVDYIGRISIIDFESCVDVVDKCEDCRDELAREDILEALDEEGGQGEEDGIDEDESDTEPVCNSETTTEVLYNDSFRF